MKVIAAAVAGILALGAVVIAAGAADAADARPGTTTITMRFVGPDCEGCTVQPVASIVDADGQTEGYSGKTVTVHNEIAVMRVPTNRTGGMSFRINGPKPERINAEPVLVIQYQGHRPGTMVTAKQALASKQASGCWAGTDARSVSITVKTMTVRMPVFPPDGKKTTPVTAAWVVPTQKAPGNFDATYKGIIATQDLGWPCNAG